MVEVRHDHIQANGLSHHVIIWEPDERRRGSDDPVCPRLPGRGSELAPYRRVALWHGATGWWRSTGAATAAPSGWDAAATTTSSTTSPTSHHLVEALVPGPLHLVGHSMGATACILFAGTFPQRVQRLVLMEGLGPPEPAGESPPERTATAG